MCSHGIEIRGSLLAQKLIIDADPGIGDAIAIAVALMDSEIDVLGITATAGCVVGRYATRNVHALVEMLDPAKWPRLGSSDAAKTDVGNDQQFKVANPADLNGPMGLGDVDFAVADLHRPHESAKLMVDLVREQPHEITLLTLGPLTNVQVANELAPDFLDQLNGIVCLGGSIAAGGDVTAAAEFNVYANPQAARNLLRSPATKTLVPLDVSNQAVLTFEQFNRLKGSSPSRLGRLLEKVVPFALRAHHEHLGLEGLPLRELVALAAVSQTRLFEREAMMIDVETSGELTRGMTVFDRRGVSQWQTNIDVMCDVDAQGVLDYLARVASNS